MWENSKMYILVRKGIPKGHAISSVAHASLACYLKFDYTDSTKLWLRDSFKKITCKVNDTELQTAMHEYSKYVEITESALDHKLICVAFKPDIKFPECFYNFKLYK